MTKLSLMATATVSRFLALLAVAAQVFVLATLIIWVAGRWSERMALLRQTVREYLAPAALLAAWLVALVATVGSLYYSEVAHFTPHHLCWFQRIAMYPLVLILGIAALKGDLGIRRYVIPLAVVGGLISVYHYQLQRFPGQGSLACAVDTPCTLTWVWQFHYISIPLMALSAFALIVTILALGADRGGRNSEGADESVRPQALRHSQEVAP